MANMSRGYSKVYNRKLNAVSQTSIQFDKLFHENSNRPSAAKSAGTVGKWGVISCTSLRSTNFNGRKEEILSNKRMRVDYGRSTPHATSKDPFSFDVDTDSVQNKVPSGGSAPKPKKFFKSRNIDMVPPEEIRLNASVFMGSNRSAESSYGSHGGKKYGKGNHSSRTQQCTSSSNQSSIGGSKKFFTSTAIKNSGSISGGETMGEQMEAMNLSSPTKNTTPLREENKPPIVLRISKGTSHLVNEVKEPSNVQQSSKPSSENSFTFRCTRQRHGELGSESWSVTTHESSKEKSSCVSIMSPKKLSKEKDTNNRNNSENVSNISLESQIIADIESNSVNISSEKELSYNERIVEVNVTKEQNVHDIYEGTQTIHDEKENIASEAIINDVDMSSLSFTVVQKTKDVTSVSLIPASLNEEVETVTNENTNIKFHSSSDLEKEDEEKLMKTEELLSNTYVDFSSATEKLLMSAPKESSKTILDQDWFSDSEDSNSIADQINTIASSQGECEADIQVKCDEGNVEQDKQGEGEVGNDVTQMDDSQGQLESEHNSGDGNEGMTITTRETTSSPAAKKGSIFKSRSLLSDGSKKRLALYKHKWVDDKDGAGSSSQTEAGISSSTHASQPSGGISTYSDLEEEFEPAKLTRVVTWPTASTEQDDDVEAITSVKCNRKAKGAFAEKNGV
ncbi:hypothetical protein C0J52_21175 [Blattella germanica]|nr:hypothetical protein C0J52_21175 [Blattella germanica]